MKNKGCVCAGLVWGGLMAGALASMIPTGAYVGDSYTIGTYRPAGNQVLWSGTTPVGKLSYAQGYGASYYYFATAANDAVNGNASTGTARMGKSDSDWDQLTVALPSALKINGKLDGEFSVDILPVGTNISSGDWGLVFNKRGTSGNGFFQDTGNLYIGIHLASSVWQFECWQNGVAATTYAAVSAINTLGWNKLSVICRPTGAMDVYLNGVQQFTYTPNTSYEANLAYVGVNASQISVSGTVYSYFDNFYAIPEPASLIMLGCGGLWLMARRRR